MSHHYEKILVAIDGSYESELAFEKGVNVALRNGAELLLTHVIDTRALQSVATFDTYVYEKLEQEAKEVLDDYEKQADIPDKEGADLIMVGATGLNTFERLLIGSSSEYIMRHAKVDLLVVRDSEKTF